MKRLFIVWLCAALKFGGLCGCVGCLCACSGNNGGGDAPVVALDKAGEDAVGFEDVFRVVETVPLELNDDCILSYIIKVEAWKGNFYVLDGQLKSVCVFDRDGRFVRRIGTAGPGHGEYASATDFTLDEEQGRVAILSGPMRVYCYDLQGNFISSKDISPYWSWKIAASPGGFVGLTQYQTYTEGEHAFLFYTFDRDFNATGEWVDVRKEYCLPMPRSFLQKSAGRVYGFDDRRNAIFEWDGRADSMRQVCTFRFAHPMPAGVGGQEEYMNAMFRYDVMLGGAVAGGKAVLFYLHDGRQHAALFGLDGTLSAAGPYEEVPPALFGGEGDEVLLYLDAGRYAEFAESHPGLVPRMPADGKVNAVVLRCRLR